MKTRWHWILILTVLASILTGDAVVSSALRHQTQRLIDLRTQASDMQELRAENERLKPIQVNDEELKLLRLQTTTNLMTLLRLRGEVTVLRNLLDSSNNTPDWNQTAEIKLLIAQRNQLQDHIQGLQKWTSTAICMENLEQISLAKDKFTAEKGVSGGYPVTPEDLAQFFTNGLPKCPAGGRYIIGRIGAPPVCSIPGHAIP